MSLSGESGRGGEAADSVQLLSARTNFVHALACGVLMIAGGASAELFIIAEFGGDTALAAKSPWIYAPLVVALLLTGAAIVTLLRGHARAVRVLIPAAAVAYVLTWSFWGPMLL